MLTAADGSALDESDFGQSVVLSSDGNTLLIGSPGAMPISASAPGPNQYSEATYVFKSSAST